MIAALRKVGWAVVDIEGSHHQMEHTERHTKVTIPVHGAEIIAPKTLRSVLRQADLTVDELRELL